MATRKPHDRPPAESDPRDDEDGIPFADDAEVVAVDAAAVSDEFEQAPDTALDLFGRDLEADPERTSRDPVPIIAGEEVRVVVGRPESAPPPVAPAATAPVVSAPAGAPESPPPEAPKYRPKLLGRAIVERNRRTDPPGSKKPGT